MYSNSIFACQFDSGDGGVDAVPRTCTGARYRRALAIHARCLCLHVNSTTLVVPVLRSCQSPIRMWLVNYLHYIYIYKSDPVAAWPQFCQSIRCMCTMYVGTSWGPPERGHRAPRSAKGAYLKNNFPHSANNPAAPYGGLMRMITTTTAPLPV